MTWSATEETMRKKVESGTIERAIGDVYAVIQHKTKKKTDFVPLTTIRYDEDRSLGEVIQALEINYSLLYDEHESLKKQVDTLKEKLIELIEYQTEKERKEGEIL